MRINNIQNRQTKISFQALRIHVQSEPGTVIYDGIRHALLPEKGELVSHLLDHTITYPHGSPISKSTRGCNLGFTETPIQGKSRLGLHIGGRYDEITPNETDTAETFGERIKAKLAAMVKCCGSNSGIEI